MFHYLKRFIYFFCIFILSRAYAFTGQDYQIADTSHALSSAMGQQNIAVFLLNFLDNATEHPWSREQAKTIVFKEVNDLVREFSYEQSYLDGIVIGYYTIPIPSTSPCYPTLEALSILAIIAAQTDGIDLSPFDRHIYMFPFRPECPFKSHSTIGFDSGISKVWVNGSSNPIIYLHGLGHNFGLFHSHYRKCTTCSKLTIGDRADVMGSGPGHFNSFQKELLGWLSSGVRIISCSGNYTIDAFETKNANTKTLKIIRRFLDDGSIDYYYLELRQPIGFDAQLATCGESCDFTKGLLIHMGNSKDTNSSDLLTMRPAEDSKRLVTLLPGESYKDAEAAKGGVTITLNAIDNATANVSVIFGNS